MKAVGINYFKGYAKILVENPDDLWSLSQILDKGDIVSGMTLRKLKIGGEEDRKQKALRKPVFIKLKIEKVEFSESQTSLRVLGTIEEGPEDIPKGEHHTFNIEEGTDIKIEKARWLNFQKEKLEEAISSKLSKILIVVFDREEAYFALMKRYGYEMLAQLHGNVAKKGIDNSKTSNFYVEIITNMEEYDKRYNLDNIVVGSPAFWKDELLKNLNDGPIKKRMILATCSSVGKSGINELLKRPEVKKVLSTDRTTKEINLVEDLLREIGIGGKASYGIKLVETTVDTGATEILLVTDSLIQKLRKSDKFERLERIMKIADSKGAKVHIISSKHEGGKKLDGLGGIGAILRYKMNY
jgi:protein pelota